jgi:hypothetical protein
MKKFALFITTLTIACAGSAETLYTTQQETPVRDKPVAIGSNVIARLKAGTMIETVKQVGAFTTVSFIHDGKVKTGFIQTSQINNEADAGVATAAVEDPASLLASKLESMQVPASDLATFAATGKLVARKPKRK